MTRPDRPHDPPIVGGGAAGGTSGAAHGIAALQVGDLGRLLLEDVCSDLLRWHHSKGDPAAMERVHIDREFPIGTGGDAFVDIRVEANEEAPYFVEVKYGYSVEIVIEHMRRKYGHISPGDAPGVDRVVLVAESATVDRSRIAAVLPSFLQLEVWDEDRLRQMTQECFGQSIDSFALDNLSALRVQIDRGREAVAFGSEKSADDALAGLRYQLLWHFGMWRLQQLRNVSGTDDPWAMLPPGVYQDVVAVYADLSGFSRAMKDTPDDDLVRHALTNFYVKARYQVINAGGMLDQFVGDAVIAIFGVPDRRENYIEVAARTAFRLTEIGASVAHDWQRGIDTVQPGMGVHVGMAIGRVQLVPLRSHDHTRLGVLGEPVNLAARLVGLAGPGQVVVSNVVAKLLGDMGYPLARLEPVEVHNMGHVQPWLLGRAGE